MSEKINFTINGFERSVEIEGWEKILDVIREDLNMTGTKRGCDDGTCGACTVLLDGKAIKSCLFPAKKLNGKSVMTIEGVSKNGKMHPIQQALIDAGAVQCGYCTPGIVMELIALYSEEPDAAGDRIKTALAKHLCRCTGYEAIYDGAILAKKYLKDGGKTR